MRFYVMILYFCIDLTNSIVNDDFKEELLIKPLSSGHTYFHFQFTTLWNSSIDNPEECKLMIMLRIRCWLTVTVRSYYRNQNSLITKS